MSLTKDIRDSVYEEIKKRPYNPGEKIPGIRELAIQYNTSYVTMSNALLMLVNEGILKQYPGKGSFVTDFLAKNTLALVLPDYLIGARPFNPETDSTCLFGLMDVYAGLLAAVERSNYNIHVIPINYNSLDVQKTKEMLLEKLNVAGVFFLAVDSYELVDYFDKERFPYCVIHTPPGSKYNHVAVDIEKGTFYSVSHLAELGHKRIALISNDTKSPWFQGRYEGYKKALEKYNIKLNKAYIKEKSMGEADIGVLEKMVDGLLSMKEPPTAIFVTADRWALHVMDILKKRGIRIPEDLSVSSFDDYVGSRIHEPPLTTVRQPFYQLGEEAFALMCDLLKNPAQRSFRIIDPLLIVRKSTGSQRKTH